MFKVGNKGTRTTSLTWTYFIPFSSVSIFYFQQVNVSWNRADLLSCWPVAGSLFKESWRLDVLVSFSLVFECFSPVFLISNVPIQNYQWKHWINILNMCKLTITASELYPCFHCLSVHDQVWSCQL